MSDKGGGAPAGADIISWAPAPACARNSLKSAEPDVNLSTVSVDGFGLSPDTTKTGSPPGLS